MEFGIEKIKNITDAGRKKGLNIKVKDVAFHILRTVVGDSMVAYRATISAAATTNVVNAYEKGAIQKFIRDWTAQNLKDSITESNLSFEDNKAALIKMIKDVERLEEMGELEHKDAIKMITDIRVKLNDKFSVQDDDNTHVVVVPPKYNKICPRFHVECYEQTAEYAMSQFHLIPDPNWREVDNSGTIYDE